VLYNEKHAHWKANEAALLHVHPEDWIRIEVMHMTKQNEPRFLAAWQGRLVDLPTGGGKNGVLKPAGVKRILFRISKEGE
jgi:hypothetical protein